VVFAGPIPLEVTFWHVGGRRETKALIHPLHQQPLLPNPNQAGTLADAAKTPCSLLRGTAYTLQVRIPDKYIDPSQPTYCSCLNDPATKVWVLVTGSYVDSLACLTRAKEVWSYSFTTRFNSGEQDPTLRSLYGAWKQACAVVPLPVTPADNFLEIMERGDVGHVDGQYNVVFVQAGITGCRHQCPGYFYGVFLVAGAMVAGDQFSHMNCRNHTRGCQCCWKPYGGTARNCAEGEQPGEEYLLDAGHYYGNQPCPHGRG